MPTTVIPYRSIGTRYVLDHDDGPVDVRRVWDALFILCHSLPDILEEYEYRGNESLYLQLKSIAEVAKVVDCLGDASGRADRPDNELEVQQRIGAYLAEMRAAGREEDDTRVAARLRVGVNTVARHRRGERGAAAVQDAAKNWKETLYPNLD